MLISSSTDSREVTCEGAKENQDKDICHLLQIE